MTEDSSGPEASLGGARPSSTTGFACTLQVKSPDYLVTFRQGAGDHARILADTLQLKPSKSRSPLESCELFTPRGAKESIPRVYGNVGVAALDLSPDEKARLERHDDVEKVVENAERTVPPFVLADEEPREPPALFRRRRALVGRGTFLGALTTRCADLFSAYSHDWPLHLIGIPEDYKKATGKGVRVAVLDSGVDLRHPDFEGRFVPGENAVSFVKTESVQDEFGHGTYCTGVITGPARPSQGPRYGVAPDACVLVGKVLNNNGRGNDDYVIEAISWALEQGASIIALSLGSRREVATPFTEEHEKVAAESHANGGNALFIAAAGNWSKRPASRAPVCNPAACPSYLSVAAINEHCRVWDLSSAELDPIDSDHPVGALNICAPGDRVRSAWKGGGYIRSSGSSMAAPHVAGVAALIRELEPGISWKALWKKIEDAALPVGDRSDYGAGLVQAP